MLYDPKWEQQTKDDTFTLASLIAWMEQRPAKEEYCYMDYGKCLIGQYLTDRGFVGVSIYSDPAYTVAGDDTTYSYPKVFNTIAKSFPRTFGAALARARAALL